MAFQQNGVKVNAVVEKIDVRLRKRNRKSFYPVFAFEANGRKWSVTSAYGGGQWQGKEGTRYDLYYDPANPEKIQLLDFSGVLFWTTFFSCGGAVCLTIGAWKLWFINHFPS